MKLLIGERRGYSQVRRVTIKNTPVSGWITSKESNPLLTMQTTAGWIMLYSSNLGIGGRFHTQTILFLNQQPRNSVQLQEPLTPSASDDLLHQASKPLAVAHTSNTMNFTLPSISFQSPCLKIQPAPQPSLWPPRQQSIKKTGWSLKPIHAALVPDANGGLNNADRRGATLPSSPLSDVLQEFYSSLNEKNSKRLDKLMAPDCIVEDTAYYKPLDAKVNFSSASASWSSYLYLLDSSIRLARFLYLSSQKEEKFSHAVYPYLLQKTDGIHGREGQIFHRRGLSRRRTDRCSNVAPW